MNDMHSGNAREIEARSRQIEALRRAFGFIVPFFKDDLIIEIMLNTDGAVWIERAGHGMERVGSLSPVQAMAVIQSAAALVDSVVTHENPVLECELPNGGSGFGGARMEGLIPPVVQSPVFAIRKKASLIFTLDDYVDKCILSEEARTVLSEAIRGRKNVVIAGGTGTGKTTFANALLHEVSVLDPDSRIVIIEDTLELQCAAKNAVFLRTSETVDQTRLLRATMRLRPDRIVVGEVRDKSALALLKAWNTGHPGGLGTVHANDARAALIRLGQLIQEANVPPPHDLIAEAVDIVVSIKRIPGAPGRIIDQIVSVDGWNEEKREYVCRPLVGAAAS